MSVHVVLPDGRIESFQQDRSHALISGPEMRASYQAGLVKSIRRAEVLLGELQQALENPQVVRRGESVHLKGCRHVVVPVGRRGDLLAQCREASEEQRRLVAALRLEAAATVRLREVGTWEVLAWGSKGLMESWGGSVGETVMIVPTRPGRGR